MIVLGMIVSYLIGSIPTAYIFGKLYKKIDIREHGSGNIGATNVFRVLGKWPGTAVLLLDIIKGAVVVTLVADVFGLSEIIQRILLSLCVIGGHNWTVFLNFKGGKGVATTLGVLIGFTVKIASIRLVLVATVCIFIIAFLISAIVSLSSITAATALPILMVLTSQPIEMIVLSVIFCIFVVLRHRPNIKRLLSGQEPQVPLPFHKKK